MNGVKLSTLSLWHTSNQIFCLSWTQKYLSTSMKVSHVLSEKQSTWTEWGKNNNQLISFLYSIPVNIAWTKIHLLLISSILRLNPIPEMALNVTLQEEKYHTNVENLKVCTCLHLFASRWCFHRRVNMLSIPFITVIFLVHVGKLSRCSGSSFQTRGKAPIGSHQETQSISGAWKEDSELELPRNSALHRRL